MLPSNGKLADSTHFHSRKVKKGFFLNIFFIFILLSLGRSFLSRIDLRSPNQASVFHAFELLRFALTLFLVINFFFPSCFVEPLQVRRRCWTVRLGRKYRAAATGQKRAVANSARTVGSPTCPPPISRRSLRGRRTKNSRSSCRVGWEESVSEIGSIVDPATTVPAAT